MTFNWRQYLDLADELIAEHRTPGLMEAYFRSAVSRAYYGAYHDASGVLVSYGRTIPMVDTHKFVREEFQRSKDRDTRKIGVELARLWTYRKNADYDADAFVDDKVAAFASRTARSLVAALPALKTV